MNYCVSCWNEFPKIKKPFLANYSNLEFLNDMSPNHLTTTPPASQEQYFKEYLIMPYYHSAKNNIKHCKRSITKFHDKAKHFKIKTYA